MKISKIFTYDEGPWYEPSQAINKLGHTNPMLEKVVLSSLEYEKRRLFALDEIRETPLYDEDFNRILIKGFSTMAKSLVDQYQNWQCNQQKTIRSITIINNQGICDKHFTEILKGLIGIDEIPIYHITGMHCGSSFLALQHLSMLYNCDPRHKDECDLIFSIEVQSVTLLRNRSFRDVPFFTFEMLASDGAALAVAESSLYCTGLEFINHRNFFFPLVQDTLPTRAVGNQMEIGTSPKLVEDIKFTIKKVTDISLADQGVSTDQIDHWVLHPGSVSIVSTAIDALGLKEGSMKHEKDTIKSQGNTNSSLILYVLRRYFESNTFQNDDLVLLIGLAPGFEIQTITGRYN